MLLAPSLGELAMAGIEWTLGVKKEANTANVTGIWQCF
jgi:hypothetical protein